MTSERLSWKCDLLEAQLDKATKEGKMLKKILNKRKEETDSSSDSEDDTVPHVGKKAHSGEGHVALLSVICRLRARRL